MSMDYIEHRARTGIPIPHRRKPYTRYRWQTMKVGECIQFPEGYRGAHQLARQWSEGTGWKFLACVRDRIPRVWRTS